eukprot:TRINITY_DN8383_c0_g1_i1.p1 TRINITY_DN8383_c0_g1~~TRINITY_DN8383_c0_g1_i1.p1  ORF type:complete len:464 (-),score=93.82 TRINITY_DN8383_c0_g1_i1:99-1490(-)
MSVWWIFSLPINIVGHYDLYDLTMHSIELVEAYILMGEVGTDYTLEYISDEMDRLNSLGLEKWVGDECKLNFESFIEMNYDSELEKEVGSPKAKELIQILHTYSEYDTFRCVIFVQMKKTTYILRDHIAAYDQLGFIKYPIILTGQGKTGMTKKQQTDAAQDFRDGKSNTLIATSVAEEGLDISACNVVIRYDSMDTVTSFIQSRGRARADNANFHVIYRDEKDQKKFEKLKKQEQLMLDVSKRIMMKKVNYYNLLDLIGNEYFIDLIRERSISLLQEMKDIQVYDICDIRYEISRHRRRFMCTGTFFDHEGKLCTVQGIGEDDRKCKVECAYNALVFLTQKYGIEEFKRKMKNRYIHIEHEEEVPDFSRISLENVNAHRELRDQINLLRKKNGNAKSLLNELSQKLRISPPIYEGEYDDNDYTRYYCDISFLNIFLSEYDENQKKAEQRAAESVIQRLLQRG